MIKVVKVYLISAVHDAHNNEIDYKLVNRYLWQLQDETQLLKNKIVQLCWEWYNFQADYKEQYDVYPTDKEILGYTLSGYIYDVLKSSSFIQTGNMSITLNNVCKHFKKNLGEYKKGTKSIINYKRDQPLDLHSKYIKLSIDDTDEFYVNLSLLNKAGIAEFKLNRFDFKMLVRDTSTRCILERCYDGTYKIVSSQLWYDRKKKLWRIALGYDFDVSNKQQEDAGKILGVDLGISKPIVASVYGDLQRFVIEGDEIIAFRNRVEQRKRALQKQSKHCGDGRIGHGCGTRLLPVSKLGERVSNFRDTTNYKYAKSLIDYAIRHNCTTIQMEDLTGIIHRDNAFLQKWSYCDLQSKIIAKAQEHGITVVKVNPRFTSQRCSHCGHISKENRISQSQFKCINCGFEENADYNASQNIALPYIDTIIEQWCYEHNIELTPAT